MKLKNLILYVLSFSGFVALMHILSNYQFITLNREILIALRWMCFALITLYSTQKQNLTLWILVAMFIGIEFGLDFPEQAKSLKVLSDIFLRLIKTIIAPLLFATLVVGIAGHSNIKQVGRMGL